MSPCRPRAIAREKVFATNTGRRYYGPDHGSFAPPPPDFLPADSGLRVLLKKKRKERKKIAQETARINYASPGASPPQSSDDGDGPDEATAAAPVQKVSLTEAQTTKLKELLLSGRALVQDGIETTKYRDISSPFALDKDELVDEVETVVLQGEEEPRCLMSHQKDAIGRWEENMSRYKACLLADDMGLGKTIIIISIVVRLKARLQSEGGPGQFMTVVPRTLLGSWQTELRRAPSISYTVVESRNIARSQLLGYDVILATHGAISQSFAELEARRRDFHCIREGYEDELLGHYEAEYEERRRRTRGHDRVGAQAVIVRDRTDVPLLSLHVDQLVIDEAHHMKNPDTILARGMRTISADCRGSLTGTPFQNHLSDFGALLQYHRIMPFCIPGVFKSCFVSKKWKVSIPADSRNTYHRNDAIISAVRAAFSIRRVRDQTFDGEPMLGIPDWHYIEYDVDLSNDAQALQEPTRWFWDKDYQRMFYEEEGEGVEKPFPGGNALVAIVHARMHAVHPMLHQARYSEFGVDDIEHLESGAAADYDLALRLTSREDISETEEVSNAHLDAAALASERLEALRSAGELAENVRHDIEKRRTQFLDFFRQAPKAWRSDKLYGVAETISHLIAMRLVEASKLRTNEEKNHHLATHKILVFCEHLSALDILEIGLLEEFGIQMARYDGIQTPQQRAQTLKEFGEDEKKAIRHYVYSKTVGVLALTTRAGAEGITLEHASDVFIVAPAWNPFIEDQIIERAARKVREKVVTVHRFLALRSCESLVHERQKYKRTQTARVLDDRLVEKRATALTNMSDAAWLKTVSLLCLLVFACCRDLRLTCK